MACVPTLIPRLLPHTFIFAYNPGRKMQLIVAKHHQTTWGRPLPGQGVGARPDSHHQPFFDAMPEGQPANAHQGVPEGLKAKVLRIVVCF